MRRSITTVVGVLPMVLALLGVAEASSLSEPAKTYPRKLVIVAMPGVTWEDVAAGHAPNLKKLANAWSIGVMSIRTVGSRTDEASAFATLGAGNRSRGLGRENVEFFPNTAARLEGGLVVEQMDAVQSDNADNLLYGAEPGAFGDAIQRAGLTTAVVGNSDGGAVELDAASRQPTFFQERRFLGLALANEKGRIDGGNVGESLVERDLATTNGYRSNPEALVAAFEEALSSSDIVLLEIADTYREGLILYAHVSTNEDLPAENVAERLQAIERDDGVIGHVVESLDLSQDTLVVLGTTGLGPAMRERLMIAAIAGVGAHRGGLLTSPTTKRPGIITLADVAPGILNLYGIEPPGVMTGQEMRSIPSHHAQPLSYLLNVQGAALFHARAIAPFFAILVVTQLGLYLAAWRPAMRSGGKGNYALRAATLGFLAMPGATFVWHGLHPERIGVGAVPLLLGICALLAAASLAGPWRRQPSGPPAFLCLLTFLIIGVDLATGANLQLSSLIGYSPIVAGRFFGIGNLDFAVFGTAAVLGASTACFLGGRKVFVIVALMTVVSAGLNGAPMIGADFGGLLAMVVGFGVLLLAVSGRRISWKTLVLLALLAVGVGLLAAFVDWLRPTSDQTHLGRFLGELLDEGPSFVRRVILRKALANWSLVTASIFTFSVPIAVIFLFVLFRPPRGRLRVALIQEPGFKAGLMAAGALNLAGFVANDSGIAVPAMGLAIAVPYCLAIILATHPKPRDIGELGSSKAESG